MEIEYPFIIRGAADAAFCSHARALFESHGHCFQPNPGDPRTRKFWRIERDLDAALHAKKDELIARFGIVGWIQDPRFKDLVSAISAGGSVHPHLDMEDPERLHVRINLMIDRPLEGGMPILDGILIPVEAGDAWLCFASRCEHATTVVRGDVSRVIISYGLQVERSAVFPLFSQYLFWARAIRGANKDLPAPAICAPSVTPGMA